MPASIRWRSFDRLDWVAFGLGLAVLATALCLARLHPVGYLGVETDFFGSYAPQARNLLSGERYVAPHAGPGYPVLLGIVSLVVGDLFVAGKVITAIASCLLVWLSYDLIRRLSDRVVATAAVLLLSIVVLPYSYLAATDVPGAVIALAPMWMILRRRRSHASWFIAGALAGVAYLFRHNFLFVVIAVPLAALIVEHSGSRWRERGVRAAVALAGAFLIVSPWLAYSVSQQGDPFASTAHVQIAAHFFHPEGDTYGTSLRQVAGQFDSVWDVIAHDPAHVAKTYARGLYWNSRSLLSEGLGFPALIFAGGGMFILAIAFTRRIAAFLVWGGLGYMLLALVGFHLRYYLFLFPLLALLVSAALFPHRLSAGLTKRPHLIDRWGWTFLLVLCLLMAYGAARRIAADLREEPVHLLEMADVLRTRADPGDTIVIRKPHLAFHAGLVSVFPLAESADEFRLAADEAGARFLEYSREEARLWPGLEAVAEPASVAHLGFRVLYESEAADAILYELEPVRR